MSATLDTLELRKALGCFATGVTVITTRQTDGSLLGFTANSFSSVSLDPPLVMVCIANTAAGIEGWRQAPGFAVNILSEEQQDISAQFARRGIDKFSATPWQPSQTGNPLLDDTVAWLDCRMHQVIPMGDHDILIGRVLAFEHSNRSPLGFVSGAYLHFGLLRQALAAMPSRRDLRVGGIVEVEGNLLLQRTAAGLTVPSGIRLGGQGDEPGLQEALAAAGYEAELPYLFAVYEDGAIQHIVHRGQARRITPIRIDESLVELPLSELQLEAISSPAERAMIARFLHERESNVPGIYVGDANAGTLLTLAGQQA
ncbi:MAG: flavin reductase family protein [Steroidobacteraceae bacterium]